MGEAPEMIQEEVDIGSRHGVFHWHPSIIVLYSFLRLCISTYVCPLNFVGFFAYLCPSLLSAGRQAFVATARIVWSQEFGMPSRFGRVEDDDQERVALKEMIDVRMA
jgi:hypothetical protein